MSERIVGGFLKNDREMIAGTISPFQGQVFVHLRTFVPSAVEEGEWVRTTKGVSVVAERFQELRDAVKRLSEVAGTDVVVARIERGDDREIRVGVNEFNGNLYCYVRTFFRDEEDGWHPSRKGVSVPTARLADLDELVDEMSEAIAAMGPLAGRQTRANTR